MRKAKNQTPVTDQEKTQEPTATNEPKYFAKTVEVTIAEDTIRTLLIATLKQNRFLALKRGIMPVENMRELIDVLDEYKPEEYMADAILKTFSVSLNVSQGERGTWTAAYTPLGKK